MKRNEPADAHKTDTFSATPIAACLCRVCERGFSIQLFELRLSSPLCFKVCRLESRCPASIPHPPCGLIKDALFAGRSPAFQTCSACYSFIMCGSKHWRVLHFCEWVKKGRLSVWGAMNYEYDKVRQGEEECSWTMSITNIHFAISLTQLFHIMLTVLIFPGCPT